MAKIEKIDWVMLDKAWCVAVAYHDGQFYGEDPYIRHVNDVAVEVNEYPPDYIAVAYLHDVLEDTEYTETDLRMTFPAEVADAVVAITKVKGEAYLDYILKVRMNSIALVVKRADTLCNLAESVKMKQWKRVKKYSEQMILLCE